MITWDGLGIRGVFPSYAWQTHLDHEQDKVHAERDLQTVIFGPE